MDYSKEFSSISTLRIGRIHLTTTQSNPSWILDPIPNPFWVLSISIQDNMETMRRFSYYIIGFRFRFHYWKLGYRQKL